MDSTIYTVTVAGYADELTINSDSPFDARTSYSGDDITQLIITTDQSGIVGLIRHLHGRGFTILSVKRN
jgi:hypothetical protein